MQLPRIEETNQQVHHNIQQQWVINKDSDFHKV